MTLPSLTQHKPKPFCPNFVKMGFPGDSLVKNLPAMQEMRVWAQCWKDCLEEEVATHSGIPARKSHGERGLAGYSPWGCKRHATYRLSHHHRGHQYACSSSPWASPSHLLSCRCVPRLSPESTDNANSTETHLLKILASTLVSIHPDSHPHSCY